MGTWFCFIATLFIDLFGFVNTDLFAVCFREMLPSMCCQVFTLKKVTGVLGDTHTVYHSVNGHSVEYEAAVQCQCHLQYSTFWASLCLCCCTITLLTLV